MMVDGSFANGSDSRERCHDVTAMGSAARQDLPQVPPSCPLGGLFTGKVGKALRERPSPACPCPGRGLGGNQVSELAAGRGEDGSHRTASAGPRVPSPAEPLRHVLLPSAGGRDPEVLPREREAQPDRDTQDRTPARGPHSRTVRASSPHEAEGAGSVVGSPGWGVLGQTGAAGRQGEPPRAGLWRSAPVAPSQPTADAGRGKELVPEPGADPRAPGLGACRRGLRLRP